MAASPSVARKYLKMWYKSGNAWGIRRKFLDKGQAFQIGGKKVKLSKDTLEKIANHIIHKMENNDLSEADAKQLGKEMIEKSAK